MTPSGAMTFGRTGFAVALLLLPMAGCDSAPSSAEASTYEEAFDVMWNAFDKQYPYFELKQIDWNAQRTAQRPRAASAKTLPEFLSVVRATVAPLRDGHVFLEDPSGTTESTYRPERFPNWDRDAWLQYMARSPYVQHKPNLGTSELDGVPYLIIGAWSSTQFTIADLDAALERFRGRDRLIVDVRPNPGGNDALALALAARFTTQPVIGEYIAYRNGPKHSNFTAEQPRLITPRGSWQFIGRVYLLVGRWCAISNESFVSFMREIPSVTVVGDTTAGMTGNPKPVSLIQGWKVWVPQWMALTAQHNFVEWNGIAPDVLVKAGPADFVGGHDPVLDFAISALRLATN